MKLVVGLLWMLACALPASAAGAKARLWTIEDIVTAPEINSVAISVDGGRALYIVRQADLVSNRKVSALHLVQLSTGEDRVVARGAWMEEARTVPQSDDWSVLADIGSGVQLYRVDRRGGVTPIVVNPSTVVLGKVEGAVELYRLMEAPLSFGVLSYRFSPDGRTLWYSRAFADPSPVAKPLVDADVTQAFSTPRRTAPGRVEFRLRRENGDDERVAERPTSDRPAVEEGGAPIWSRSSDAVRFTLAGKRVVFELHSTVPRSADDASFSSEDFASRLSKVGYRLGEGDPRVPGSWLSSDGTRAVMGVRYNADDPRGGLIVVDPQHVEAAIGTTGGLTACDFTPRLDVGVCVRQGMTIPPELVRVGVADRRVTRILSLAPTHDEIAPLRVEPRVWRNPRGYQATGFLVYPREYRAGRRYPAILVTHGSDADERFASADFQWQYPVQVFAERGYVVIAVNDPAPSQSETLKAAVTQWSASTPGPVTPAQLQDEVWLSEVELFEAAVRDLAAKGLVDVDRVGIAGYSRGSQMVNVTMTQSTLFKAGSSGDGGYLEPSAYYLEYLRESYVNVYGGSPYAPAALENYRRLSPTFRADRAPGAILQQISGLYQTMIEFHDALRAAGKPSQMTLYPGETLSADDTHLFHIPSNRLAALQENLDWFDFWLRGMETPEASKQEQYRRWRDMRDARAH
ncbi:MAG: prolyl oligopeptidase family serine peptidase [Gammaproteobacteria bacterium]